MKDQDQKLQQNVQTSSTYRIRPQSFQLIQKTMINVALDSFLFGYMLAYFNSIDFDKIMIILQLNIERSLGQGLLTSCLPFNAGIGALLSSFFLKMFTRKNCFYAMNTLCILAPLLIQTKLFYLIFVGRFLQGIFVGINSVVAPLYIKQFVPQMNGKYGLYHQLFIMTGVLMGFLLNYILIIIFSEPQKYWRFHFSLPVFVCLFQMYQTYTKYNFQTPRYLVAEGRHEEAKNLLNMIYKSQYVEEQLQILKLAVGNGKKFQVQNIKMPQKSQFIVQNQSKTQKQLEIQLSQRINFNQNQIKQKLLEGQKQKVQESSEIKINSNSQNFLAIFTALHLSIYQQAVGVSIIISYGKDIVKMVAPQINDLFPIFIHLVGCIAVCFGITIIKTYGRVQILQFGGVSIFTCLLIITVNFFLEENKSTIMILVAVVLVRGMFSFTLGPCIWLYMAEIVKPNIYPYGAMLNWLTYGSLTLIFPIISQKLNPGYIFLFNTGYIFVSIIINYFCLVETKNKNQITIRKQFQNKSKKICC